MFWAKTIGNYTVILEVGGERQFTFEVWEWM